MFTTGDPGLGAIYLGEERCSFRVWAPLAEHVDLHIVKPQEMLIAMYRNPRGYYHTIVEGIGPGTRYMYRIDGQKKRPDPASRYQPDGVHEPSQVIDPFFAWTDTTWTGVPLQQYIIYEMHIGTFTAEGTFEAAIAHLDTLKSLGITAIEVMPVAQFPGSRNWGYDGAYPYAVQASYGGPTGLKQFVDACHQRGLAVILDVVYNHLGPEGNYLWDYAPYFTDHYKTPWGSAVNFDGAHSDEVRRYFIENALMWITDYHIDALRLDAVHAMYDFSAHPFLADLADAIHRRAEVLGRQIFTIAESDLNDPRHVHPPALGGYGLDAQWNDDFHHSVHTLLTHECDGYYEDFGDFQHLTRALRQGWVYAGDYSIHRQRRHGAMPHDIPFNRLVVCTQNHDQVGNRMLGERLTNLVSFEALKLAAGTLLLSPFIPLLFMGQEHGEKAPFLYFISHGDPGLVEAVRKGRKQEFETFAWKGEPPDPQAEATFKQSQINHSLREKGQHKVLFELYRQLIHMRKALPALALMSKDHMDVRDFASERVLFIRRWDYTPYGSRLSPTDRSQAKDETEQCYLEGHEVVILLHFGPDTTTLTLPFPSGHWRLLIDSSDICWLAPEVPDDTTEPSYSPIQEALQPSIPANTFASERFEVVNGEIMLTIGSYAFALFTRSEEL